MKIGYPSTVAGGEHKIKIKTYRTNKTCLKQLLETSLV